MAKNNADDFQYFQIMTADGLVDIKEQEVESLPEECKQKENKPKRQYRKPLRKYKYSGPVIYYGTCVKTCFQAETMAVSEKQAHNNILCQFKREAGKEPYAGGYRLVNRVKLSE